MRILFIFFSLLILSHPAFAASGNTGIPDTSAMDELLHSFETAAGQWPAIIKPITTWLFWSLVTISWVWNFGQMVLKNADGKELIAELFVRTFMVGFFWYLLNNATDLAAAIVNSFSHVGALLAGGATLKTISPSSIFDIGISLASQILNNLSLTDPADSIAYMVIGLGILVVFAFITLNLMVVIIQYYILLNLGVIMMGFLGHEYSREYGINYFKVMLALGVKYLVMQVIIVLTMSIVEQWISAGDLTWMQIIIILPIMIVIYGLAKEVPQLAQSLISGSDHTNGNAVAGAIQGAAMVAAAGIGGAVTAKTMMGKGATGAADTGHLLKNAWNAAKAMDGSDSGASPADPATSPPPEPSGVSEPSGNYGDYGDSGASSPGDSGTSSPDDSGATSAPGDSGAAAPNKNTKRGFASTAKAAAGIATRAIGNEIRNSAVNAFKKGASSAKGTLAPSNNSIFGRAANSLNSTSATAGAPQGTSNQETPIDSPSHWSKQSGGFDSLNDDQKAQASNNFEKWKQDPKHTLNIDEYVDYAQTANKANSNSNSN